MRMLRWPAQVISYKVGEQEVLKLKAQVQVAEGKDFDIRAFHQRVLEHGSVPLDVLRETFRQHVTSAASESWSETAPRAQATGL